MTADRPWEVWGNVPDDGDVRAFSRFAPVRDDKDRNNKKHHYLSVTYMNGFLNDQERVWAYRLDDPTNPHPVRPASIGFEKYYYSQALPDGSKEHHRFEDLWNGIETVWDETRRALVNGRLSHAISFNVLGMATITRVRVPAARERNEVLFAAKLRAVTKAQEAIGTLPAELSRYAGQFDTIPVGINPHETLHAMQQEFMEFGDLCFRIGFEILHNKTGLPFITSDNPVCIYDPTDSATRRIPYDYGSRVELIFPLDARTVLRGSDRLSPTNQIVRHRNLGDRRVIREINRTVAQFSYKLVVASDRSSDRVIIEHAANVPTVEVNVEGTPRDIKIVWKHVFGPRPTLSTYIDTPEKAARLEAKMARSTPDLDVDVP